MILIGQLELFASFVLFVGATIHYHEFHAPHALPKLGWDLRLAFMLGFSGAIHLIFGLVLR